MASTTSNSFSSPASRDEQAGPFAGIISEFRDFWHHFFQRAFDPYRPELHYMRGPGPAWHAKQAALTHLHTMT